MALMKSKEVPKDAVILDELEATEYAWQIVTDWNSTSDVWALKYGPMMLGGINAMSGIIINNFYRKRLNLASYGYFASVIPISMMPALLTALFHRHLVSSDLLLMKSDSCPVCYEMRAGVVQLGFGLAYPMLLGPVAALMLASRYCTYRVPDLKEGPKVMFKFLRKTTRPFTGTMAYMAIGQLIASSVITYYEMRNNFTVRRKIMAIEARLEAKKTQN